MIPGLPQWPGETVAILGGGPSLRRGQVLYCRGRCRVIAINRAYEIAPWADLLFAHERRFWDWYPAALEFKGAKVTCHEPVDDRVVMLARSSSNIEALLRDTIYKTYDSGCTTEQLAAVQGAARILLLGFDARDNGHWHNGYPEETKPDFALGLHRALAELLNRMGVLVLNCTPNSAIDAYPMMRLEDVI